MPWLMWFFKDRNVPWLWIPFPMRGSLIKGWITRGNKNQRRECLNLEGEKLHGRGTRSPEVLGSREGYFGTWKQTGFKESWACWLGLNVHWVGPKKEWDENVCWIRTKHSGQHGQTLEAGITLDNKHDEVH